MNYTVKALKKCLTSEKHSYILAIIFNSLVTSLTKIIAWLFYREMKVKLDLKLCFR